MGASPADGECETDRYAGDKTNRKPWSLLWGLGEQEVRNGATKWQDLSRSQSMSKLLEKGIH